MGNYRERIISLLYPRRCPVCDQVVPRLGMLICPPCKERLEYVDVAVCIQCGKPVDEKEELCKECRNKKHYFDQGVALYRYPSVKQSIFKLKYEGRREYLDFYAKEVAERMCMQLKLWNPDVIIGVPLHKQRERKRGYNQAGILAEKIGCETGIPFSKNLVLRQKNTLPQKGLDTTQRQNNLKKAFIMSQNDVKLKTIVVIDDIYTTGSTMDAVASVLKAGGVEKVYCICLAIGG